MNFFVANFQGFSLQNTEHPFPEQISEAASEQNRENILQYEIFI